MSPEEATSIAEWVAAVELPRGAICLNIGSSTEEFRTRAQPHIEPLFRSLEANGLRIVHCDLKAAEGVDEVGDVLDRNFQTRLQQYEADLIICSNLLEHLTDPELFTRACGELVKPGGYGLITVPLSYPLHPDPIDTGLRLKPHEIAELLPDWKIVRAAEIETGSYLVDIRSAGGLKDLAYRLVRAAVPFYRPQVWKAITHRLLWLFRPYRQSMVLLRKPLPGASSETSA